jgi:hypothetical protein
MFTVDQIILFLKTCERQGMTMSDVIQILQFTGSEQIPVTIKEPVHVFSESQSV